MKINVGKFERALRIIVGLAALGAGFYFKSWWGLVGLVPLTTGTLRWCPIYSACNLSTCAKET